MSTPQGHQSVMIYAAYANLNQNNKKIKCRLLPNEVSLSAVMVEKREVSILSQKSHNNNKQEVSNVSVSAGGAAVVAL